MRSIVRLSICLLLLTISLGVDSALAVDKALYLDGDGDFVQTPLSSNTQPLTIEISIESDVDSGEHSIVDSDVGGYWGQSLILGYWDGDNTLDVQYHDGDYDSPFVVQPGVWYHAAAVFTSGEVKLYVNGNFVGSNTFVQSALDGDNFRIGRHNASDPQWFNGLINEVRIWNVALTQEQIRATMNTTLQGDEEGLVGYWNFDDGTANDSSPYGNHGTLEGNAKIVPHGILMPPLYQRAVALSNAVSLSWRAIIDPTGQFDHYAIYRATKHFSSVAGMAPIGKVAAINITNYLDNTAINGKKYYYAVTVVSKGGGEMTDVVSISPLTYVDRENVRITPDGYIASWLFLDPYIPTGVGSTVAVADDYLKESIPGGEKGVHKAHPKEGDKIKIKDEEYVWTRMNIQDLIDMGEIPQTQVAFGRELDIKFWGGDQVNSAGEYLVVYLLWKKDTTVTFTLGSDDSSESYFNDQKLTYTPVDQDWSPDNGGTGEVNVKAGKWNTLLVGVYETGVEWGFSVKVDPIPDEIDNTGRAQADMPTGTPILSFDIEPKD